MAAPLVSACPVPLAGATVLDFGAGTGATSAALLAAGSRPVAADLSFEMLRVGAATRPPAVAGDVLALPFARGAFDIALGAFVLSHLEDPARGLAEVARTVRPGGAVMALGFSAGWDHPAKAIVDGVAARFGFEWPAWYQAFKRDIEPLTSTPARLVAVARDAELADVAVTVNVVDTGVSTAPGLMAWRLGMPACADFVAGLGEPERRAFIDAARDAIGDHLAPLAPELLVLCGRVSDDGADRLGEP